MPQYELMYLLGSNVADEQVPTISEQVKKFIGDFGGSQIQETQLGKKKLAYPIKKTRNGHYVVVNFAMDTGGINKLDARIRTQNNSIIRYIIVNLDEHLERLEKDKAVQAKLNRRIPQAEGGTTAPSSAKVSEDKKKEAPIIDLAPEDIDAKIEKALSEDLTK